MFRYEFRLSASVRQNQVNKDEQVDVSSRQRLRQYHGPRRGVKLKANYDGM